MRKTIIGYCNEHQAQRSSDGYDLGIVRVHVYGPDHEDGDLTYDKPATITLHDGVHERMLTESEVRAIVGPLSTLARILSQADTIDGVEHVEASLVQSAFDDMKAIAVSMGVYPDLK
jgi:hypothetical protein